MLGVLMIVLVKIPPMRTTSKSSVLLKRGTWHFVIFRVGEIVKQKMKTRVLVEMRREY